MDFISKITRFWFMSGNGEFSNLIYIQLDFDTWGLDE
jgi:hypothetical protein